MDIKDDKFHKSHAAAVVIYACNETIIADTPNVIHRTGKAGTFKKKRVLFDGPPSMDIKTITMANMTFNSTHV